VFGISGRTELQKSKARESVTVLCYYFTDQSEGITKSDTNFSDRLDGTSRDLNKVPQK
jgi:hypothetical protein